MFHSLKTKVLFAIVGITIVTAVCISVLFYMSSATVVEENYGNTLYNNVGQSAKEMDDILKEIYYIGIESSCNEELLQNITAYVDKGDDKHLYNAADILMEYKNQNTLIQSIYLFLPKEKVVITSSDYQTFVKDFKGDMGMTQFAGTTPLIVDDPLSIYSKRFLSFQEGMADVSGSMAYIMVNVAERDLYYGYLDSFESEEINDIMLVDGNDKVASTKHIKSIGKKVDQDYSYTLNYKDSKSLVVISKMPFSGYHIVAEADRSYILKDLDSLKYDSILMSSAFILFSILPAYIASKRVNRPIARLKSTMDEVRQGDLSARVEILSKDDISVLSQDFNTMLDQLEDVLANLIQEKIMKKDAELESLQYQITPHFMYNTLNSIKLAALLNGEEYLGKLLGGFIELLQASINKKGAFLTVEEEMHILKNYVELQLFRYQNSFQIEYHVQMDTQNYYVPRLILQPLVENAILHGLDMKIENCVIKVSAQRVGKYLMLMVEDNGKGMSADKLKELFNSSGKAHKGKLSGIGVSNIRERLRLYYEDEATLQFTSDSEEGTKAIIQIPASMDYEQYLLK